MDPPIAKPRSRPDRQAERVKHQRDKLDLKRDRRILNEEHPGPIRQLFQFLTGTAGGWLKWIWMPFGIAYSVFSGLVWLLKWGLFLAVVICVLLVVKRLLRR